MSKLIPFIRLDFATVKPYLMTKNILIFIVIASVMILANNGTAAIAILMLMVAMSASYPFSVGEKSNIDILYTTLSVQRKTVVQGRYLFALLLNVFVGMFAFIFSLTLLYITQNDFVAIETLSTILIFFILFSLMQAFQLPMYFKLGFSKAKLLTILPIIVLPWLLVALSQLNLFGDLFSVGTISGLLEWFSENILITALSGGALWFAIMFISYKASVRLYEKREF